MKKKVKTILLKVVGASCSLWHLSGAGSSRHFLMSAGIYEILDKGFEHAEISKKLNQNKQRIFTNFYGFPGFHAIRIHWPLPRICGSENRPTEVTPGSPCCERPLEETPPPSMKAPPLPEGRSLEGLGWGFSSGFTRRDRRRGLAGLSDRRCAGRLRGWSGGGRRVRRQPQGLPASGWRTGTNNRPV